MVVMVKRLAVAVVVVQKQFREWRSRWNGF
jgi:hypothetical protein